MKNKLNAEEIFYLLDEVCDNEKDMTDDELSLKLSGVYDLCPAELLINHQRSKVLVSERVDKYCLDNKIEKKDYDGPLPYKLYLIDAKKQKDSIEKLRELLNIYKKDVGFVD